MKVSLNTAKQYIDFDLPPVDELVARVNAQLGGVEEVIDLGARYKDARIVKVVECEKHPNADKLSVCKIDDGSGELVQVVCGAPNAKKDMWAVWLPPKSIVPSSFDDAEPFTLDAREIRGEISHGMLASARELGIGDDHQGIVGLNDNDLPQGQQLAAGASFAEVFGLDDYVIDIENKMFTHRPDLFGQLGVAREIAGIFGHKFEGPKWYYELLEQSGSKELTLEVFNESGTGSPRASFVAMSGVKIEPSPLWLQCALVAMGAKPINNVVDVTNYIMLMTAQPVHAYDYGKIRGGKIGVRMAKSGEKVKLLNEKVYELDESDIVIADSEGAIGLAGIMGGFDSEVTSNTKNIILEVANFDMYAVRRSSMKHGLFTDALTRFNKGQSLFMIPYVQQRTIELLSLVSGAVIASEKFDDMKNSDGEWRARPEHLPMESAKSITTDFINSRLGLDLSTEETIKLLENVGFECNKDDDGFSYWAPAWRMDIQDPEDIVEEVGRLYGFDKLPRKLPQRTIRPAADNQLRTVRQSIRDSLSRAGANEVLTYSFVHENTLRKAEQDVSQAFRLSNALSPDLQYYRLTVLPSLLDKVHMNIKAGHDEFVLYEIGKGHNKKYHADDDEGLPSESQFVDAVYTSKQPQAGAAFYHIRRLLDQVAHDHGLKLAYTPVDTGMDYPVTSPFDLSRSAMVNTTDGDFVGMIGELRQSVVRNFKLPKYTAAMTLDLQSIVQAVNAVGSRYVPLSRYPSVWQDLSLRVSREVGYGELTATVHKVTADQAQGMMVDLSPTTIYQSADGSSLQTITYRITATHHERTLTDDDLRPLVESIVQAAASDHGAELG